ncbi:putative 2OG-Fe(II) oxygenase, partial [Sphingobium sp.]|uniref:putative 2OG-Fe(II) oxygenase n=1 Tax=Sphingobium sp. TaxID=1912891 RepID=UPI003B3B7B2E
AAHPRHVELRMALYRRLMAVKAHDAAKAVIDAARRELPSPLFDAAAAAWEAEHGDRAQAHAAFCAMPTAARDQMALPHVRLLLRMQRFDEAERVAITALATAQRDAIWPYLSTIWRLTGNSNAAWLDGDPPYIRTFDLGLSDAERDALATVLRGLHARAANFPGQSVRGGTQTDQPLFFRAEPEIRRAKAAALDAVRRYIAMLPPPQTGHPLLGVPRNHLLFEGSWSVLLQAAGFHATHTHPRGWISAVCYISRPAQDALGPAPAGWLELGTPPPELGLSLPPLRQVEPIAGRIALFPSTMWHHTIGFSAGERLTIAFDVRPPRR